MGCTVIAGGFWGDEGKGKIVSYLALRDKVDVCMRTGSVNAAHTVVFKGRTFKLHMVPAAFVQENCRLLIGAGANIDVAQLQSELNETGVNKRLKVDRHASIIEPQHSSQDKRSEHLKSLGTTGRGVGPAVEERVKRSAKLAKDIPELKLFLADTAEEVNTAIDEGKTVILEGTQGLMLSLYHGTYPFVTSRDTSASAICSEAGVGPSRVDNVLLVLKAFITRVGAGDLPNEISREEAIDRGWFERAAGTGRERRSAPFNFKLARRVARINGATELAVTKLDILYNDCAHTNEFTKLPKEGQKFITKIEEATGVPVTIIGTGPDAMDIIDRRSTKLPLT